MSAFFKSILKHPARRHVLICVVSIVACVVWLMFTDPGKGSLALLLVPFMLLGAFVYHLTYLVIVTTFHKTTKLYQRVVPITVSFVTVIVLLLQSLNQLGVKDGLILLVLIVVFWLYLWRADFLNK